MLFKNMAVALLVLAVTAANAASIPQEVDGQLVERDLQTRAGKLVTACTKKGSFALTFDDGPVAGGATIAAQIKASGGFGTFFVNGANFGCIYDRAEDLLARFQAGHLIASHTWGHTDITTLTPAQLNKQLDLVEEAMIKILGVKPRYFRPPYGNYNAASLKILYARGYNVVYWGTDSGDSVGSSVAQSVLTYQGLISSKQNAIVLNHETVATTPTGLIPAVLPLLKAGKYSLQTVAQCIGDNAPYTKVGKPQKRDATWTCAGKPGPGAAQ